MNRRYQEEAPKKEKKRVKKITRVKKQEPKKRRPQRLVKRKGLCVLSTSTRKTKGWGVTVRKEGGKKRKWLSEKTGIQKKLSG